MVTAAAGATAGRRRPGRSTVDRRALVSGAVRTSALALLVGGATSVIVGYGPVPRGILLLLAVGVLVTMAIYASPTLAAILLGLSLSQVVDVTGGHFGLHVAPSDLLLVIIAARVVMGGAIRQRLPALLALRPVAAPVLQYAWLLGALILLHLGVGSGLKSLQRLELFAAPLVVGSFIALRGQHILVLRGYVLATTVLAVTWPLINSTSVAAQLQLQKNPVGGFIASAILVLFAVRGLRRLMWCMPLLLLGLGLAASRGAILGLAVGMVAISVAYGAGNRRVLVARTLVIVVTGLIAYQLLPADVAARITNFSDTRSSASSWALIYRNEYYHDAELIIAAHPWTGVGVGEYLAGVGTSYQTADPHNVILLEAAEGGYVFAVSFVLLIVGAAFVLWRMRRVELAAAAAGVLLASVAHGMVDVYWVRGTPVLGWLLVGMVCGLAYRQLMPPTELELPA